MVQVAPLPVDLPPPAADAAKKAFVGKLAQHPMHVAAGSRARACPVPGHPCLDGIEPAAVVAAVTALTPGAPSGAAHGQPSAAGAAG